MIKQPAKTLIFGIARKIKHEAEQSFAGRDLTLLQYAALKRIAEGAVTQHDVARELVVKPPSLVPILDSLEAEGYLSRRTDASDRRRMRLSLTAKAKDFLKKTPPPSSRAFDKALRALGTEKKERLEALLQELAGKL